MYELEAQTRLSLVIREHFDRAKLAGGEQQQVEQPP